MKRLVTLAVYVIAILATQSSSFGQSPPAGTIYTPQVVTPVFPAVGFVPSTNSVAKFAAKRTGDAKLPDGAYNGYSHLRSVPDLGAPGSSGAGFSHFPMPMDRYTNWYRPKAATLTQYQRCEPESFRPRGFGNLFARPCDGFRMDYQPYMLSDGMSSYGPAYPARMPDPRCPEHCEKDCKNCQ